MVVSQKDGEILTILYTVTRIFILVTWIEVILEW